VVLILAVMFLAVLPYVRFVVQRNALDAELSMIALDYKTVGRVDFEKRADGICQDAGLEPGSYKVDIWEDTASSTVGVKIKYRAEYKLFFVPRTEHVVLQNSFSTLDL
jgi:hypothetical protein